MEKWVEFNRAYADKWPVITQMGTPPANAADMDGIPDKFEKYFSPEPAART